jgi:hypothetical protein
MLIERYKKYVKNGNGLHTPEEVTLSTNKYREENDIYIQYVEEDLEETRDENDILTENVVYTAFTSWYSENYPTYYAREKPGKRAIRKEISKRIGNFTLRGVQAVWMGWKLKGQ